MWTLLSLAVRNILRNKSRTALTLGAIGFGVLMTLFLGGFAQGFINMLVDDTVKGRCGAMQVHRKGYFDVKDNQPLDYDFAQGGALEAKLRAVPGVTAVTPRLVFSGLVSNGSASTLFVATAMDPASMYDVLPGMTDDLKGAAINAKDAHGGVVGLELADSLEVSAGSTVILQAARKGGQQNALDLDVIGTLNNGNAFEAKRVAYVPLAFAQELLGMEGRVTEYALAVNDREAIPAIAVQVQAALGSDYEVQTWRELRPNVADVARFVHVVLGVVCFVFLVIAVIGVVNTMLMSVLERTREIGTMLAVGVRRAQVTVLFLFEALTLAVVGGGLGAALGSAIVHVIAARGGVSANAPGTTVIKYIVPETPAALVTIALVASVAGALVAAVYPAWRASRLRPVEALRAL
jgi:putative ABC transport system permease protein